MAKDKELFELFSQDLTKLTEQESIDVNDKSGVIKKLFQLPDQIVKELLDKHLIDILSKLDTKDDQFNILYDIFNLSDEIVTELLDKHLVDIFISCNWEHTYIFSKISELPPENSLQLLNKHLVDTLSKINKDAQTFTLNEIFELPDQIVTELLDKHLVDILSKVDKGNHFFTLDKISRLSDQIVTGLLEKDLNNILNQIESSTAKNTLATKIKNILDTNPDALSQDLIKQIHKVNAPEFKILLKYTSQPLAEDVDPSRNLHQLVQKLLEKTYTDIEEKEKKLELIKELNEKIIQILDADKSLSLIIENSINTDGDFYIIENVQSSWNGLYSKGNIFIKGNRSFIEITSTLIHESTHKVIDNIYQNYALPYPEDDNDTYNALTELMQSAVKNCPSTKVDLYMNTNESNQELLDKDSWFNAMVSNYSDDKYAAELFAWCTQYLTKIILGHSNDTNINDTDMDQIWNYFQKLVIIPLSNLESPEGWRHLKHFITSEDYSVNNTELALTVKKILSTDTPSIDWLLDSKAGQIAFKFLPFNIRDKMLEDFITDADYTKLDQHLCKIIKAIDDLHQSTLLLNIFDKLPPELLEQILTKKATEIYEAISENNKYIFENKIRDCFSNHSDAVEKILENHPIIKEIVNPSQMHEAEQPFVLAEGTYTTITLPNGQTITVAASATVNFDAILFSGTPAVDVVAGTNINDADLIQCSGATAADIETTDT